ncbi:MAG: KipI antagonist, partial [Synergistetes bacterium HGW-Synergistetes-2]
MPGMLTTVQDSGRWSYQGKGMPVAGAMDMQSFALGNILVGNDENAAALEVTLLGPSLSVTEGEGVAAVTGAELGFTVNGEPVPNWTVVTIRAG